VQCRGAKPFNRASGIRLIRKASTYGGTMFIHPDILAEITRQRCTELLAAAEAHRRLRFALRRSVLAPSGDGRAATQSL
jgi:hypothetical protein